MDEDIVKVLSGLRERQREFMEKAAKIEESIKTLEDVFGSQISPAQTRMVPQLCSVMPVAVPTPATGSNYGGMRISDAAVKCIRDAGVPLKTRQIADALETGGLSSSDMYRAVYNALDGNDSVSKTEGKKWVLTEWGEN